MSELKSDWQNQKQNLGIMRFEKSDLFVIL